jgi:hypothetical protein
MAVYRAEVAVGHRRYKNGAAILSAAATGAAGADAGPAARAQEADNGSEERTRAGDLVDSPWNGRDDENVRLPHAVTSFSPVPVPDAKLGRGLTLRSSAIGVSATAREREGPGEA